MTNQTTITHVAAPRDRRCNWWQAILPDSLTPQHLSQAKLPLAYFQFKEEIELDHGTLIIESEARHPRRKWGHEIRLGRAEGQKVVWLHPNLARKTYIKAHGGQHLMDGSGDVAGALRMALWLREQTDQAAAWQELREVQEPD